MAASLEETAFKYYRSIPLILLNTIWFILFFVVFGILVNDGNIAAGLFVLMSPFILFLYFLLLFAPLVTIEPFMVSIKTLLTKNQYIRFENLAEIEETENGITLRHKNGTSLILPISKLRLKAKDVLEGLKRHK